jgi:2-oxo-4-hydroxy-4-carboxy-5-ureidoimidazoline decarboxylase
LAASNEIWRSLAGADWSEAFHGHPRIGESGPAEAPSLPSSSAQSAAWSTEEQASVAGADATVKNALADANREYERRFNRIFIVCASDKSAPAILEILRRRLHNDRETELQEAAEQQRQIIEIRLRKWLRG